MKISAKIRIKSTIREGSVFYFKEETFKSAESHYFVVLNLDPKADEIILLVCSRTLDLKVATRYEKFNLPRESLVDINPKDCKIFKNISLFDCNQIFEKPVQILIDKLNDNKLKMLGEIEKDILLKLRDGVIKSPLVKNEIIKKLIAK